MPTTRDGDFPSNDAPPPWRYFDVFRLVVALGLSASVIPYCAGRAFAIGQISGTPEGKVLAILAATIVVCMACNYGLSARFRRPWLDRMVFRGVLGMWIVSVVVAAIMNFAGDAWHRVKVTAVLLPASLWGAWALWMFYKPIGLRWRFGVLGALLVPQAIALAMLRIDGMDGYSHLNFAWRWQPEVEKYEQLGRVVAAEPSGDEAAPRTVVAAYPSVTQDDFPEYLGPRRDGVLPHVQLDPNWDSNRPKELWRRKLGLGWSGFAIVGNDAFTQEQRQEFECVVCYDALSGDEKWVHTDQANFTTSMGGAGPRGTPTIREGRVFTMGATGKLNALEAATGRVLWTRDVQSEFNAGNIDHGVCGSPLVVDDLVIVAPTGSGGPALAAYRCADGQRVWSSVKHRASYGSPTLVDLAGRRQVLVYHNAGVSGVDPVDGRLLWEKMWSGDLGVNCSQPLAGAGAPDQVFIGTGYSKGSTLIKLTPKSEGTFDVESLWTSREMKLKFTTAVIVGDYIYGLDDGRFECISLKTGKKAWKKGNYGHGQILLVGGLILVQAESGEVVLLRPDSKELIELGKFPGLDGRTWNVPALARGKLYIRNDREAACYRVPLLGESVSPEGTSQATTSASRVDVDTFTMTTAR